MPCVVLYYCMDREVTLSSSALAAPLVGHRYLTNTSVVTLL